MAYNIEVLTLESVYLNIQSISGPKNTKYCLGEGFYLLFFFPPAIPVGECTLLNGSQMKTTSAVFIL